MRRAVLFCVLVVLDLSAVACQPMAGEAELPDEVSLSHDLTASPTQSPTGTSVPTAAATETHTHSPTSTHQPTHTPTVSPTATAKSTAIPIHPTAMVTPTRSSDCPPDVGCLMLVNLCPDPLVFQLVGAGLDQEVAIDANSDTTLYLPHGHHEYRASAEVFGCMWGGQGFKDRHCVRLNTDYRDTVMLETGLTSRLVLAVTCQQWDGGDCIEPSLTLLEVTEPPPTPTIAGSPTATATSTPVCKCSPDVACLTVENHIAAQLFVEIRGGSASQDVRLDPNGQAATELPEGRYDYTAHTSTGYEIHYRQGRFQIWRAGNIYLSGRLVTEAAVCHRLAFSIACGWWDEGRCFSPELVLAD